MITLGRNLHNKEGEENDYVHLLGCSTLLPFCHRRDNSVRHHKPYSKTNSSLVRRHFRIRRSKAWDPLARQITLDWAESTAVPTHLA